LSRFEPGTQGEHKISRGFTPVATWSNHWIIDPEFGGAVAEFLDRERLHVEAYMDELATHIPYRQAQCSTPPQKSAGPESRD
jgi:predicted N-acyltransferase